MTDRLAFDGAFVAPGGCLSDTVTIAKRALSQVLLHHSSTEGDLRFRVESELSLRVGEQQVQLRVQSHVENFH